MTEYLFRGQTRRHGEKVYLDKRPVPSNWVYGGIFQGGGDFSIIYSYKPVDKWPVYSDTVGQYTGKSDNEGQKVFVGDFVMYQWNYYEVVFSNCQFVLQGMGLAVPLSDVADEEIHVVGNRYDNLDMLKLVKDGDNVCPPVVP